MSVCVSRPWDTWPVRMIHYKVKPFGIQHYCQSLWFYGWRGVVGYFIIDILVSSLCREDLASLPIFDSLMLLCEGLFKEMFEYGTI